MRRDQPGVWGDPLEELEEERLAFLATVEGWLDPEGRELDGEPAEIVGDGEEEEAEWKEWVLPIFVAVTAKTLDVAADSAYALTWQQQRALIIRRINATTAAALEGADVPRRRVIFGLTPGNVATLTALEAELRKRGASEEDIQARLRAESIALRLNRAILIAENETIAAHAGAVTAAWSEGLALGLLPAGTRRQWKVNIFSLICPICAFLDEQIVGINEPFIGPDGSPYHAPGFHPRCRCKLRLVKGKTMSEPATRAAPPITTGEEGKLLDPALPGNVRRGDITDPAAYAEALARGEIVEVSPLPAVLSEATIPPALAAGMGPVAKALLVAAFNAYTAAGLGPYMALDAAKSALWAAGFWCNSDGTWTRPEKWEERAHEEEEYRSPKGIMRAGKVLSAANAKMLRSVHDSMQESCTKLATTLRACGYMEEEAPAAEPAMVGESTSRSVSTAVGVIRSSSTGEYITGWANVSTDADGKEVFDQHRTNFPIDELDRAMDELGMHGDRLVFNDEHGHRRTGVAVQALTITPEIAAEIARNPKKTGVMAKFWIQDPEQRKLAREGKLSLSVEGKAEVVRRLV